ncbi:MAG: acylneuraminate cytidylyltransferase family protein [Rhodospirillales bacterium]|nr:acylneuraminate cytidylyltransferase family protein [Rhodospirillales bacterium]
MIRRLAIVPARGGSKRLPGKNIRDFCGKPMIGHILDAAQQSDLFEVIHISTDSEEIIRTVEALGYGVDFPRPAELADDHTPLMPVLKWVAETYRNRGQEFDEIWLLMACSPLVEAEDLKATADLLETTQRKMAVLPVCAYPAPTEWAYEKADNGKLVPVEKGMFAVRSQDLKEKYFDTGTFVAYPASNVLQSDGAGSDAGFIGQVLPRSKAVDIDDEDGWKLAETLFRGRSL